MNTAAALLRQARRRAGLSQTALARRAGVTQPVVSAYERGHREPSLATLRRLVAASGHSLEVSVVGRQLPDTPMGRRILARREEILAAAGRRGATHVRIFGSAARGDDREDSDVDVLVDLDGSVGLVGLVALEQELGRILGRAVDVVPARSLKPDVGATALAEAVTL